MISNDLIAGHYDRDGLLASIEQGFTAIGRSLDGLTIDDLAPVDEFHTGGRAATEAVLGPLALGPESTVLDVGCGLGGAARYCASTWGSRVTGIDLTPSYIEAARAMTGWVGLDDRVTFEVVAADELPFAKNTFDAGYLLHVGMNVADKTGLLAGLATVVRAGGELTIYDLMRVGPGDLAFPVPWSTTSATSFVATVDSYRASLDAAGFEVVEVEDHHARALAFFEEVSARAAASDGPPPVGLHLLMGSDGPAKVANLVAAITDGTLSPVAIRARVR